MTVEEETRATYAFLADLALRVTCRRERCPECRGLFGQLDAASIGLDNAVAAAHQHVRAPSWLERAAW